MFQLIKLSILKMFAVFSCGCFDFPTFIFTFRFACAVKQFEVPLRSEICAEQDFFLENS